MKKVVIFFVGCFLTIYAQAAKPVETVREVDLSRYAGKWYEIARIPQSFQKKCVANTTADYSELENGKVKVVNSCETQEGERIVSTGRAKVVDKTTNAKLRVTFVKIFGWIYLFGGDYWVIDLESNYRYAVVGNPNREYGWILSREPSLAKTELNDIARRLEGQGYDTCKFLTSRQKGGLKESLRLCDYLRN